MVAWVRSFPVRSVRVHNSLTARGDAENAESYPSLSLSSVLFIYFFVAISCCSQSGDDPQQDLAKFGYKKNMKVKKYEKIKSFYILGYPT